MIEDAAEAHGSEIENKKVGSFSDMSCFSFYSNKTITSGEGGMIVTKNKKFLINSSYTVMLVFLKKIYPLYSWF